jgi:putative chitinase
MEVEKLKRICLTANGKKQCEVFAPLLTEIMPKWGIDTLQRQAMFIAQVLHESGEFRYLAELGSDEYLEKYDTGQLAENLGNTPEDDGDGQLYKGRGLIQVTGKDNYRKCGQALQLPLLKSPELLEQPRNAVASACWYWKSRNLSKHADLNAITACSIAINGRNKQGTANGIDARKAYWKQAKLALGIA